MLVSVLSLGYLLCVAGVGWVESKILGALRLGANWGGLVYAMASNVIFCVVAPLTALCCVALGFLGVFGAINNTQHITAQEAFNAWAGPLAIVGLGIISVVRILPLVLMNLKAPFKAFAYGVLSSVVLTVVFTITGIMFIGFLSALTSHPASAAAS
jgi:hypothetical protein